MKWYLKGLNESGLCLMDNLKRHPNPLTQLRLFNFFCIFHLVRYMALLEAFYCGENIRPVLLDFSGIAPSQSSVARASEMAYTQMHKSINRFYAWGYAQKLKEKDYSKEDLLQSETPVYDEKKKHLLSLALCGIWQRNAQVPAQQTMQQDWYLVKQCTICWH